MNLWRIKKTKRKGRSVGVVSRLVKGRWVTIGWFNNLSWGRRVVASLNDK